MADGELQHLKQMADQIAANFSVYGKPAERVADHLNRFWAPSMRRSLAEYVRRGGADLEPAVIEAIGLLEL